MWFVQRTWFFCFQCAKIQNQSILRKMTEKIVIFAIVKQSAMSEEEKKTDDEGKTIPNPEGYTIVKYAGGWVLFISAFVGMVFSIFIIEVFKNYNNGASDWLLWVLFFVICALLWIIGFKITVVKVNLKISDEGLEQTRLSGSRIYPKYRLIKWGDMKSFHPNGRNRCQNFYISVRNNLNFRISVPMLALYKWRKGNSDVFEEFRNDFWETAPDHNVHVAFFAIT